jgi:GT2 family glycosyltransferase
LKRVRDPIDRLKPRSLEKPASPDEEDNRAKLSFTVEALLKRTSDAVLAGNLNAAFRYADAAWRRMPENPELLEILGRLHLAEGRAAEGLRVLEAAAAERLDPKLEASVISVMLTAGRASDAEARLVRALHTFAVNPGDRLASAATIVCRADAGRSAGWVGISSDLHVWGQIVWRANLPTPRLIPSFQSHVEVTLVGADRGWETLEYRATSRPRLGGCISVQLDGADLLGSAAPFPPDVGLDGRGHYRNGSIDGWVSLDWQPGIAPRVVVDCAGQALLAEVRPSASRVGRYDYRSELPARLSDVASVRVEIAPGFSPDLPDSPVLIRVPDAPLASLRDEREDQSPVRGVCVVIPVYRGLAETLGCIASVRETVGADASVVVIDDCTPEAELAEALQAAAGREEITLVRNRANLGFPASVNRGIDLDQEADVVILNSDVEVFPGWFDALRAAAYRERNIGTVTPLSNAGSIASYPRAETEFDRQQARRIARIAALANAGGAVDAPTGVGFCMYIRRDCLNEVGAFDETAFAKGYGEENDFCLRATERGWRHVIATDVYVGHLGSRSFGSRREALLERNLEILNRRYPRYEDAVREFEDRDPLRVARRRISQIRCQLSREPSVLLITLGLSGGVERFVGERASAWAAEGRRVLTLCPNMERGCAELRVHGDPTIADLVYDGGTDCKELSEFLAGCEIELVEFHHFLDLPPGLIEAALGLRSPYDIYVHDYSWICNRVTMLQADLRFCGEPPLEICERCGAAEDARIQPAIAISSLRRRSGAWLAGARRVIAPSVDTKDRLGRYFPDLDVIVEGWEPPVTASRAIAPARETVRVAVIGAIGDHKGYQILQACADDAARRELALDFVVIGFTQDDQTLMDTGKVFVKGEYQEAELDELIATEAPNIAFFPSVWPETWCFALTAALRANLPTAAFDLGAIAERLKATDLPRRLLPLGADAKLINDALIAFARNPATVLDAAQSPPIADAPAHRTLERTEPRPHQPGKPRTSASEFMEKPKTPVTVAGELIVLNKGLYKLSVRAGAPTRFGEEGELLLPAVTLTAAPGAPENAVQIMSGPLNAGDWVCAERDLLLVKIKSSSTAVLLTSVCAEGSRPLEISLEKIDEIAPPAGGVTAMPALGHSPAMLAERQNQVRQEGARSAAPRAVPITVMAHIQNKGDVVFEDGFWAGAPGEGLAVEAFSIVPRDAIQAEQLEYKALLATGAETPWIQGGGLCGARGTATPVVGFAIRLRGGAEQVFGCEYRGAFGSGKIVGPVTNGAPCRASGVNDPLEAIQLEIVQRATTNDADIGAARSGERLGPKFSVFRQGAV